MAARSTTLGLMLNHCPHAVTLYQRGAPYDRRHFAVGTAAHDVLHAMGERRDVDAVCVELMARGRTGHDAEGPLPPDKVTEGRALAEAYVQLHPLPDPGPRTWYELGIGIDPGWVPVDYEAARYLESRIDLVTIREDEGDEGEALTVCEVLDFKTSWRDRDNALDALQRKVQALAVYAALPQIEASAGVRVDALDLVIGNVRARMNYTRRVDLVHDLEVLEAWRREVEILVAAHDSEPRAASPGPGCIDCPFAGVCEHAAYAAHRSDDLAEQYVTARALADAAELAARDALAPRGRLTFADGSAVGYLPVEQQQAIPDAYARAWEAMGGVGSAAALARARLREIELTPDQRVQVQEVLADLEYGAGEQARAFLDALGKPSVAAVESLARRIAPDRETRERLLRAWIRRAVRVRWSYTGPGSAGSDEA